MTGDKLPRGTFRELIEQVGLLEDEIDNCVESGVLKLDLKGPRAPSLLLGLVAKLVVAHAERENRLETIDLLAGTNVFINLFKTWAVHYGREAQQRKMLKKERH